MDVKRRLVIIMKEIIVESFTMDHTKVLAPFVRKSGTITTKGDNNKI